MTFDVEDGVNLLVGMVELAHELGCHGGCVDVYLFVVGSLGDDQCDLLEEGSEEGQTREEETRGRDTWGRCEMGRQERVGWNRGHGTEQGETRQDRERRDGDGQRRAHLCRPGRLGWKIEDDLRLVVVGPGEGAAAGLGEGDDKRSKVGVLEVIVGRQLAELLVVESHGRLVVAVVLIHRAQQLLLSSDRDIAHLVVGHDRHLPAALHGVECWIPRSAAGILDLAKVAASEIPELVQRAGQVRHDALVEVQPKAFIPKQPPWRRRQSAQSSQEERPEADGTHSEGMKMPLRMPLSR